MSEPGSMQLVFREGRMGFALPVEDLGEIREAPGSALDPASADPDRGLVGRLRWRDRELDVFDGRVAAGVPATDGGAIQAVLVLCARAGCFGLTAQKVEGIFPAGEFRVSALPLLLQRERPLPYDHLLLWRRELLHGCTAQQLADCLEELA